MELKEILNFQNFLLAGLAGISWRFFTWKMSSMCKDIENLERMILEHLLKQDRCTKDKK
jgi:hypothetical protein